MLTFFCSLAYSLINSPLFASSSTFLPFLCRLQPLIATVVETLVLWWAVAWVEWAGLRGTRRTVVGLYVCCYSLQIAFNFKSKRGRHTSLAETVVGGTVKWATKNCPSLCLRPCGGRYALIALARCSTPFPSTPPADCTVQQCVQQCTVAATWRSFAVYIHTTITVVPPLALASSNFRR